MSDPNDQLAAVADTTADGLDELEDVLGSIDDLEAVGGERLDELLESLEELERVAREAEDLIESIDVTELPEAIDQEELLEAIETGEIPDAIAEGEADDVVDVRRVLRAINLRELMDVGNVVEVSREASELVDAVDDVGDDGSEDDGLLEEASDTIGDEGGVVETTVEESEELLEEGKEAASGELGVGSLDPTEGEGFGLDADDTEAYQQLIQDRAIESIEEFREALIVVHGTFQEVYEFNRENLRREDASTHSRNPTAASTMPIERADLRATDRVSTVPRQVKHSTAPGFDRIYGSRFERELEKRRGENE